MKILYVTTIGMTMTFFKELIRDLLDQGHTVDIACNEDSFQVPSCYRDWDCKIFHLDCSRNPFSVDNLRAIRQIEKIVRDGKYDIVHCHTPVAAMCTRLACIGARRKGTKIYYTAHGFHFFKGAPLLNWLIYYPVEWLCARFTDVLITINQEDYRLAQKRMKASRIEYVPGVGVNVEKFKDTQVNRKQKRTELGIPEDATLLLSVGELNTNKNHQVIIRAMACLNDSNIHYAVAGDGNQKDNLKALAASLRLENQVHLLGQRQDVAELCHTADIFCHPSFREGLGLSALEAMACGLPLITSNVHGINDYSENGMSGYKCGPNDMERFAQAIRVLAGSPENRKNMGKHNLVSVQRFDISGVISEMKQLYQL